MSRFKLGLQLYSVRDKMEENMDATLRAVSGMGYDCVEFAGYFGKSAEEVRAMCDQYGLDIVSVHQGIDPFLTDAESMIRYLKTLGARYSAIPWFPIETWKAEYEKTVETFGSVGKLLSGNGIKLLYHNHEFEFLTKRGDATILDSMYRDVPAKWLNPQLDLCWVHYAGYDPIAYLKKYGDRMEVMHIKDFTCEKLAAGPVYALIDNEGKTGDASHDRAVDGFRFRPVGYGRQDVPAIMKAAEDTKVQYVIVEQDDDWDGDSLLAAKKSVDYLHGIGY